MDEFDQENLQEHAAFLWALARSLVRDDTVADDVVQEAFAAAIARPPRTRSVRAWLAGVVRNKARMRWRSAARRARRERAAARPEAVTTARHAELLELQELVVSAVRELPEPLRSTIVRRYYEDRSASSIAEEDGVTARAVRLRVQDALARIRSRLDGRFGRRAAWVGVLVAWHRRAAAAAVGATMKSKFVLVAVLLGALLGVASLTLRSRDDGDAVAWGRAPARGREALPEHRTGEAAKPPEGTPASQGRFTVRVSDAETGDPVPAATVVFGEIEGSTDTAGVVTLPRTGRRTLILVNAVGYRQGRWTWNGDGEDVEVPLHAGLAVPVRVVLDPSGAPVARARVRVRQESEVARGLRTDAAGDVTIPGVQPGVPLRILVAAPGRCVFEQTALYRAGDPPIEIRLPHGRTLQGVVLDPEGAPVAAAAVRVWPAGELASARRTPIGVEFYDGDRPPEPILTDAAGRFRWSGLTREGDYEVLIRSPRVGEGLRLTAHRLEWSALAEPQTFALERFPVVVVTVENPPERPLSASVGGLGPEEDLTFVLPRRGAYALRVASDVTLPFERLVDVGPGTNRLSIRLESGRTLRGLVRDSSGAPAAGVSVRFGDRGARADDAGAFVLRGVADAPARLSIGTRAGQYWPVEQEGVAPWEGSREWRVPRAPRLRGRIAPVPDRAAIEFALPRGGGTLRELSLDDEGRFEVSLPLVYAGSACTLLVDGFEPLALEVGDPGADAVRDFGVLRMRPGLVLEGRVVGDDGRPIELARVAGSRSRTHCETVVAWTDEDGRFRLEGLAERTMRVRVSKSGYFSLDADGAPRTLLEVTLTRAVQVRGVVRDERGEAVAGASVLVERESGRAVVGVSDDRGVFEVLVAPGVVTFRARDLTSGPVEVTPDGAPPIVVH